MREHRNTIDKSVIMISFVITTSFSHSPDCSKTYLYKERLSGRDSKRFHLHMSLFSYISIKSTDCQFEKLAHQIKNN